MKTRHLIISGFLTLAFLVFSGITGSVSSKPGSVAEEYPVDEFTGVQISIPATVYLEQGNTHSLRIEADPSTLDKIKVMVEDDNLVIKPKQYGDNLRGKITVYVISPVYELVSLAGSGNVSAGKSINSEELTLKLAGSGDMEFEDLSAEEVEIKIAGSGNLALAGKGAEELEISIAGSGDLDAENFAVEEFEGKISGSGSCRVNVTGELNISIAGSGSVYYHGNPEINSSVAGSGSVKSLD
jgi:hypothetical protein